MVFRGFSPWSLDPAAFGPMVRPYIMVEACDRGAYSPQGDQAAERKEEARAQIFPLKAHP
jgi:hypothetical protein